MLPIFQNQRGRTDCGRKVSVKNLVVGQKILISKRGSIMGQVNFVKGVKGIFGENRKLHNFSVID